MSRETTLGRALGVFSVGLGTVQLVGPRRLLRTIGVRADDPAPGVVRAIGVRELVAGAGLLARRRPASFAWFRVAGDAMDIALMASTALRRGIRRDRATASLAALGLVSAADLAAGVMLARRSQAYFGGGSTSADEAGEDMPKPVRAVATILRPRDEVYAYWRRLEQLPTFMRHVEEVRETGDGRSHWVASAPAGMTVDWDAEITEDRPGERLAWRALPGSKVRNAGAVTFAEAPGGRGTEVRVELTYEPPAGPLGVVVAKLFGEEPSQQVKDDLRRLKQVLETGDVVTAKGDGPGATGTPASTKHFEAA